MVLGRIVCANRSWLEMRKWLVSTCVSVIVLVSVVVFWCCVVVVFLITFGSFWGAFLGRFWDRNRPNLSLGCVLSSKTYFFMKY